MGAMDWKREDVVDALRDLWRGIGKERVSLQNFLKGVGR